MTDYGIYATQALGVYIGILLGNLAIKQKPSYLALLAGSSSPAPGRLWPFFFPGLLFHPLSVHKTSKITRSKAAAPGGGTFSNLPAAHS